MCYTTQSQSSTQCDSISCHGAHVWISPFYFFLVNTTSSSYCSRSDIKIPLGLQEMINVSTTSRPASDLIPFNSVVTSCFSKSQADECKTNTFSSTSSNHKENSLNGQDPSHPFISMLCRSHIGHIKFMFQIAC